MKSIKISQKSEYTKNKNINEIIYIHYTNHVNY